MSFLQAIVLGIVQGLTEFLPVSSSGHLRVVPAFLGWEDPGAAFTAVTQLGTLAAVLLYFRKDLLGIARAAVAGVRDPAARGTQEFKLAVLIAVGTIPISVFGLVFQEQIEDTARSLTLIGTTLIALGILLLVAERVSRREREIETLNLRDGIIIGFAQAAALIPGVSRSGATITAGLFLGFDRAAAARYSFLLSVPAVVLSGVFQLGDIGAGDGAGPAATALATLLAFVTGYASIAFLLKFLVTHSTAVFVAYRIVLGAVVLVLASTGAIS